MPELLLLRLVAAARARPVDIYATFTTVAFDGSGLGGSRSALIAELAFISLTIAHAQLRRYS